MIDRKGKNMDSLESAIMAQAEVLDLRGDPSGAVEGTVIESKKDRFKG